MVQSPEELKNTAYHEAGHALVSRLLPETDPIHKVSIIPRGRALGVTMSLPEEDKYSSSRTELESRIAVLFGGRAAELVIFNRYTTGASDDIKKATKIARSMVCQLGMSEAIGPMAIGDQSQEVFIGREWVANRDHSEDTARLVDAEVKRIIDEAMDTAMRLLREHIDILHDMAAALLDRETITGEEVNLLMNKEPLPPMDPEGYRRKMERRNNTPSDKGKGGRDDSGASGDAAPEAPVKEPEASETGNTGSGKVSVSTPPAGRSPLGTAAAGKKDEDAGKPEAPEDGDKNL